MSAPLPQTKGSVTTRRLLVFALPLAVLMHLPLLLIEIGEPPREQAQGKLELRGAQDTGLIPSREGDAFVALLPTRKDPMARERARDHSKMLPPLKHQPNLLPVPDLVLVPATPSLYQAGATVVPERETLDLPPRAPQAVPLQLGLALHPSGAIGEPLGRVPWRGGLGPELAERTFSVSVELNPTGWVSRLMWINEPASEPLRLRLELWIQAHRWEPQVQAARRYGILKIHVTESATP